MPSSSGPKLAYVGTMMIVATAILTPSPSWGERRSIIERKRSKVECDEKGDDVTLLDSLLIYPSSPNIRDRIIPHARSLPIRVKEVGKGNGTKP